MDRLRHLLLTILSSDQPGEVVNAASAVNRLLKRLGHDRHWLVNRVCGVERGKVAVAVPEWKEMVAFCLERSVFLDSKQKDFIIGLNQKNVVPDKQPSGRQMNWLFSLYQLLKMMPSGGTKER